jgi:hypothetical protein
LDILHSMSGVVDHPAHKTWSLPSVDAVQAAVLGECASALHLATLSPHFKLLTSNTVACLAPAAYGRVLEECAAALKEGGAAASGAQFSHFTTVSNESFSAGDPVNLAFRIKCGCCANEHTPMPADGAVPFKLGNFVKHLRSKKHTVNAAKCRACADGGGGGAAAPVAQAAVAGADGDGGADGGGAGAGGSTGGAGDSAGAGHSGQS